jgi:recombination protein RecA
LAKKKSTDPLDMALASLGGAGLTADQAPDLEVQETDWAEMNDVVLGCGGLPRGKIIELYAKASVGKSTLAYWYIAQVQKRGGVAALFDAEGSYLAVYGASFGVDNSRLLKPEFYYGEDALQKMKILLAQNILDLIVTDSVPYLQPVQLVEHKTDSPYNMNQNLARAKMFTSFFNDLAGGYQIKPLDNPKGKWVVDSVTGTNYHRNYEKKATMIFINHAKVAIGVMFGPKTKTPGGDSLDLASAIRLGMTHVKQSKVKDKDGYPKYKIVRVKAAKNKVAIPYGEMLLKIWRTGGMEPVETIKEDDVEDVLEDEVEVGS